MTDSQPPFRLSLWQLIQSDFNRYLDLSSGLNTKKTASLKDKLYIILFKAGFHAVVVYRISHWFYKIGWIFIARIFMRWNVSLTGADIGFAAEIGPGLLIGHPVGTVIAHKTVMGKQTTIIHAALFGVKDWKPQTMDKLPVVGDNCIFGSRCMILGGIRIGNNCVIGANTTLTENLNDDSYVTPRGIDEGKGKALIDSWCFH